LERSLLHDFISAFLGVHCAPAVLAAGLTGSYEITSGALLSIWKVFEQPLFSFAAIFLCCWDAKKRELFALRNTASRLEYQERQADGAP
jgi:hypothetical protein